MAYFICRNIALRSRIETGVNYKGFERVSGNIESVGNFQPI
jgi:hypothetical protein